MAKKKQHMISAEERIQLVSDGWYIKEPALFLIYMSHIFVSNPSIRGIRTGQGRVEYNPAYIAALSGGDAEEVMKAEMIRILLRHPYRWPPRNAEVSYVASNITLNEYYRFSALPYHVSDFWDDPKYGRRNFEFYYREYLELMRQLLGRGGEAQDADKEKNKPLTQTAHAEPKRHSHDEKDQSQGGNRKKPDGGDNADEKDQPQSNNRQASDGGDGERDNADEKDRPQSDNHQAPDAGDGDLDANAAGTSAVNSALTENAALWGDDEFMDMKVRAVIEFTQQNMLSWGSIPGSLVETIVASLKPVLDYRKVLSGFRATVLSSEVTLTRFRPSRRYGFMYMGKKRRFTTRLLVGVDVSGSISNDEINLFYSTINRFFKYGIEEIHVLQFDAEIQDKPVLMKKARRTIHIQGRGGTSFQPLVDYFAAKRSVYDGLIIFTDGYAPSPHVATDNVHKLLWICNNRQNYDTHQHWMRNLGRCCWITT
jgi:predicted metal-dependent peptidase